MHQQNIRHWSECKVASTCLCGHLHHWLWWQVPCRCLSHGILPFSPVGAKAHQQVGGLKNAVAIKRLVLLPKWRKAALHSDSVMAVAVFQPGRGRDPLIQACAREIWLLCTIHDITPSCVHTPRDQLTDTADTLSHYHMGGMFRDRVHQIMNQGVRRVPISDVCFELSPAL